MTSDENEIYHLNNKMIEMGYDSIWPYIQNALIDNKNGKTLRSYKTLSDLLQRNHDFSLNELRKIRETLEVMII